MMRTGMLGVTSALLCTSLAQANLDLSNFNTNTVKVGQPWASIETKINTVNVNLEIDRGIVTTVATIEYTPSQGMTQTWNGLPSQTLYLDSLETTSWFQAQDNTAITDMSLWVGDIKVKAALQDRALASAQYEAIVKRRRDPALIESWGNGSYSLRIFPNKSGSTRKIEITFVQGMENNGALFSTTLPIVSGLASVYSPFIADNTAWPKRTLGAFNLNAVSKDGKSYTLKWEGLGSGIISANPLNLHANALLELKEGIISSPATMCHGCLDPWVAEKSGTSFFGVKALLDFKALHLESEPMERNILLDVAASDSSSPDRARKLALLALKVYAQSPYTGNLGFSDGNGHITFLFPTAVSMTAANLNKAYMALKSWKPTSLADSKLALGAFARSRGQSSTRSVALIINNETYPSFPYPPQVGPFGSTDFNLETKAFEDAQQRLADDLIATLNGANIVLFGFWNNYRLNTIAQATGGYQLGGMYGWMYSPYPSCFGCKGVGGIAATPVDPLIAPNLEWYMPPLFGALRSDAYGVTNLSVKTSGVTVDSLVVLQENFYYGGPIAIKGGPVIMVDPVVRTTDISTPYNWKAPESSFVRLAGQFHVGGKLSMELTGTWGGLKFSEPYSTYLPSRSGAGYLGASLWANQQTEAWGRDAGSDNLIAMQKLGRAYHVVNRQMSLLALEPGAELWTDMPSNPVQAGNTGIANAIPSVNSDAKIAMSGANLDSASLEEILNGVVSGIKYMVAKKFNGSTLEARKANGVTRFLWSAPGLGNFAHFQILDLTGKQLALLPGVKFGNAFQAEWKGAGRTGTFILQAKSGKTVQTSKLVLESQ